MEDVAVAEALTPLVKLSEALMVGEKDPTGQWHRAFEALQQVWTVFEDERLTAKPVVKT